MNFFRTAAILGVMLGSLAAAPVRESGTHFAADALAPYAKTGELPGAVSVFYKNGVQETLCIGYADVEKKIPMSMDRMFMQCSQTKGFCGVTMAMLLEEGKVSLDDPVSKYLPEFKNLKVRVGKGKNQTVVPAKNVVTIRMVMNHTSGLPFDTPYRNKHGWTSKGSRDAVREAAANPLQFEPGTRAGYSNVGMDVGAAVIEVVTGKPWAEFLKERVFIPLKMKDATFNPTAEQLSRAITLYDFRPGKPAILLDEKTAHCMPRPYNGPGVYPCAGAGLWLSAADQLKFYKMLMNLGVSEDGVRILKTETVRKYLAASTRPESIGNNFQIFDVAVDGYSMGLHVNGKTGWFGHGGMWGTNCMVNPDKKQLRFWVVQLWSRGKPCSWDPAWNRAAEKFFGEKIDDSGLRSYTGRSK